MKRVIYFSLILLMGCAGVSEENFRKNLMSTIGQPEVEIVRMLGAPTKSYTIGNSSFLTYDFNKTYTSPVIYNPGPYYADMPYTSGGETYNIDCTVTFEVVGKVVQDVTYYGNGCAM